MIFDLHLINFNTFFIQCQYFYYKPSTFALYLYYIPRYAKIKGQKMQNKTSYFDTKCKIEQNWHHFYLFLFKILSKTLLTFNFLYDIISLSVKRKVDLAMLNFSVSNKKFVAVVSYSLFAFSFNIWFIADDFSSAFFMVKIKFK